MKTTVAYIAALVVGTLIAFSMPAQGQELKPGVAINSTYCQHVWLPKFLKVQEVHKTINKLVYELDVKSEEALEEALLEDMLEETLKEYHKTLEIYLSSNDVISEGKDRGCVR